ncbi:hypothetical protein GE09DRAFT_1272229 [Coniochaeta sp. 2T2.1]|nr:hypothetical protein GE09DRAFT_1272229 [Coniochaeta sp. 2T2.1]
MGTELLFPPNTNNSFADIAFHDDFGMSDLVSVPNDDFHLGADKNAVTQDSECPPKSPGPDLPTDLQPSRESVTHADPPFANDGKLSSPSGDAEGFPTAPFNEESKPSALKLVAIDRLKPTSDGPEASQPPGSQSSPSPMACGLPMPMALQLQPGTPLTSGDPDQSPCRMISPEAAPAQSPHTAKRTHDSDDGPATPATSSANKKRKQEPVVIEQEPIVIDQEPIVIDLTGEDDDPERNDNSRGSAQYADAASQTMPSPNPRVEVTERLLVDKTAELEMAQGKITELQDYIFTLENRLSTAERECEEIQHSTRAAVHHRDDLTMQRNIRVENSNLKDQFEQMRRQRQSTTLLETDALGPMDKTIRKEFELINADVKDTCSSVDAGIPNATDIVAREGAKGAVELWARRLAHCSFGQFVASALNSGIRDFDIVRSIATVGLCSLVFESRFPDFTARESPLLDQYRKHILIRAGPEMLSQLDFLACESLMSESYFLSHVVMENARTLAGQLADALACFVPPKNQTPPSLEYDRPPGHDTTGRNPAAEDFIAGLARALELKAKLVLSRKRYKLVFFVSGDKFDPEAMEYLNGRRRTTKHLSGSVCFRHCTLRKKMNMTETKT